jgi:monovalent cation:H+ antiporter-2, CPA2 family
LPHQPSLVATVAAGLVFAFALGLLASRLRLPPFVGDAGVASGLAEIGVVLLMFGVGLHFSLKDLVAVYPVAVPGALAQIAVSVAVGLGLAGLWGWTPAAGALLGLALSVASTVVLLRVLEERGALDGGDGRIAVGWLIVQDLAMVLALVLLPPLAGRPPEGDAGGLAERLAGEAGLAATVALTLGKVALFAAVVLVLGRRFVPWVLAQAARTGSRELFTLAVLAAALGVALGSAELFGVSLALGAFFAGVVLNGTDLSHQAAADSLPLQDAFAVLFFVSVGMLFDPSILVREPLKVLAVLATIVVVKSLPAALLLLAAGHPVATALRVPAGLAQIGEFSFILAGLGVSLGLLPPEGRDLVLAGALLSITLSPPAFDLAGRLARRLEARPALLGRYAGGGGRRVAVGPPAPPPWRDHAVIVGHGRVGGMIGRILAEVELPFVVVERDHRLAEELRRRGLHVVWGDAASPGVLEAAGARHARLLVMAAPDPARAGLIVGRARAANPAIETVARAHSEADTARLARGGADVTVMGERELALAMADYALRRLGTREAEARLLIQAARAYLPGAGPGAAEGPARPAPEFRPHEGQELGRAAEG